LRDDFLVKSSDFGDCWTKFEVNPFKDKTQIALFKDPVRTAQ